MPTSFGVFLIAAVILALTPGPAILYVLSRSIQSGRRDGYESSLGTGFGAIFHVLAAALGISAVLATSSVAFTHVKVIGAAYLLYLGIRTLMSSDDFALQEDTSGKVSSAFKQGMIAGLFNPKTALFFLAFIPQFINPASSVVLQFVFLGSIVVVFNTTVVLIVATLAGTIGYYLKQHRSLRKGQRLFTGVSLIALGAYVAK